METAIHNGKSRRIKTPTATAKHASAAGDILDTLKGEHEEVKALLSELVQCEDATQRKKLVKQIKVALLPHTKAEQKVLYDAVIALKDDNVQEDGHEGYIEHELAALTLSRLERVTNAASPRHKAAAKVLKELVEHHIQEEESAVWADVRGHFDAQQRARLNAAFLAAKARVRVS
jgi:iron-sulfur cluster repair protein YtfE (RIC family)